MKTIIKNPRITEKASNALAHNVYIFDIGQAAGKIEIKKEIMRIYKVEPVKINILPIPRKSVFLKGRKGTKAGGKKALVYLKKGDKIEFI
ncbi:50S ribosomal protein L23 [Candidatus Nomurabacteria bacterium RIFCSPLOWO2_12_FULL_46_14]|uniref:50S ribosomal protein L23 n=1 Tax=Candidatus Nomurabacteria bacterium RIFCSPLOWO2_12_FULL_46_14 TaxID=1801797 RepID=A0A1F6Y8K4_9BACT|nr:MAG: 50S ribosomal protein L23 [Candidatus Nomurabacteria bacterium RIFCSPLOWO2_12_FULL_46_14]